MQYLNTKLIPEHCKSKGVKIFFFLKQRVQLSMQKWIVAMGEILVPIMTTKALFLNLEKFVLFILVYVLCKVL